MFSVEAIEKKKKLLKESYVLIERLKKLRALNADPRLVGINPNLQSDTNRYPAVSGRKRI